MPGTILIIDDEPRNILALSATLRARNYQCLTATAAREGIALIKEHKDISVVLLDMMMPELDGYHAIPEIRSFSGVPVIAVTAQAMMGDKEKCLAAGADEYLSKPVDVDRLLALLNSFIK